VRLASTWRCSTTMTVATDEIERQVSAIDATRIDRRD
jgi:hypothetical protein